jgi:hypothetical protein
MLPGAKFSMSTSARSAKRKKTSRPAGCFRSSASDFLLEFSMAIGTLPPATAARRRSGSPAGGSILTTVAPAMAIKKPA